jgi:phosphoketolase
MKHRFTTILVSRQHSQPCCAGTPGSIHECGGLGFAVSHTYSVALDNPDLVVACVVGDGEAQTRTTCDQGIPTSV